MTERHVLDNQKTASSYVSSGSGGSCLPKMSCIFLQNDRHISGVLIQFERETWERDLRASGVRKTLHAVTTTGQWRSTCLIASDFSLPSSSQISYQPRIGQLINAWEWPFFFSGEQHFLLPLHWWLLECSSCRCFCCSTGRHIVIYSAKADLGNVDDYCHYHHWLPAECQPPFFLSFYFNSNRERDCWQWPLWSCWKSTLTHFGCPASGGNSS